MEPRDQGDASVRRRLTVVRGGTPPPPRAAGEVVITDADLRQELVSGAFIRRVFGASESRLFVRRLAAAGRPLATGGALWLASPGRAVIEDATGERRAISLGLLASWIGRLVVEPFQVRRALEAVSSEVAACERSIEQRPRSAADPSGAPLYLRTDLSFGIRAGGSVGHIAGVLNNLAAFTRPPIFVTTDDVPTVDAAIETHVVLPLESFWNFQELPAFVLNARIASEALRAVGGRRVSFVYHRYSLGNFTGVAVSRLLGVPLALEFNGSEVWVSDHWGRPLKHRDLALRIERLNLAAADLIVVVSDPIADQLASAGIDRNRVLVNPNGVDVSRYHPDVDGTAIRRSLDLDRTCVVGFIGTFGAWHGAEVLARAFVALLRRNPGLRQSMRLLMIGDGARMAAVKRILAEGGVMDLARLPGLVTQEDGPAYMAACDMLISPHVPNPDGSPFFGSPTKLFEYMAMGRPIIASHLDQIGEVLEHDRTAWMVPPGDVAALAASIERLAADEPARGRLGAAARACAVARHTWRDHTRRIVDRVALIGGSRQAVAAARSAG
jgi:glycosyltransferase involved in cell wall biosynthesis